MKAKFINEIQHFERNGEPLDKLNIGIGPNKHIKEFEHILNLAKIEWEKTDIESETDKGIQWNIYWIDGKNDRYFNIKLMDKKGWTYPGNRGDLLENPFNILDFMLDEIFGNVSNKILDIKKELVKYNGVIKAKNILKKYNES